MKRLALFAATGLLAFLPSVASAGTHFFFGFGFPIPVPFFAPRIAYVAPAPVCVAPPVYIAPAACRLRSVASRLPAPGPVVYAPPPVVCYSYSYPRYYAPRAYYAAPVYSRGCYYYYCRR